MAAETHKVYHDMVTSKDHPFDFIDIGLKSDFYFVFYEEGEDDKGRVHREKEEDHMVNKFRALGASRMLKCDRELLQNHCFLSGPSLLTSGEDSKEFKMEWGSSVHHPFRALELIIRFMDYDDEKKTLARGNRPSFHIDDAQIEDKTMYWVGYFYAKLGRPEAIIPPRVLSAWCEQALKMLSPAPFERIALVGQIAVFADLKEIQNQVKGMCNEAYSIRYNEYTRALMDDVKFVELRGVWPKTDIDTNKFWSSFKPIKGDPTGAWVALV